MTDHLRDRSSDGEREKAAVERNRKRFFTMSLTLGVLASAVVFIGWPALQKARNCAQSIEDASQVREIHGGLVTFAIESDASQNESSFPATDVSGDGARSEGRPSPAQDPSPAQAR